MLDGESLNLVEALRAEEGAMCSGLRTVALQAAAIS